MIKVGKYKTADGRDVVINEVFDDNAYGRVQSSMGNWISALWNIKTLHMCGSGEQKDDIVIPRKKLMAYRCKSKVKGNAYGFQYLWIPGFIMMVESEDDIMQTGDSSCWERIPEMDIEVKS